MNCMEFRRRLSTALEDSDAELRDHAAECAACAAFAERTKRFDSLLVRAVRVPVPEGLSARVLLANEFHDPSAPRLRRRRVLAIAASAVIASVATGVAWWSMDRPDPLAEEIIALVNTSSFALQAEGPVSDDALKAALEPAGVHLSRPIGDVTFAGPCIVRGSLAGHVVVRGQSAKVTLLFMPKEHVTKRSEFSSYHFNGVLLPSERGAVAIIAAPGEPITHLERRVLDAFEGTA